MAKETIYEVCGQRDHIYCKCQASHARSQFSFFKAPLVRFNIIALESPAVACAQLKP